MNLVIPVITTHCVKVFGIHKFQVNITTQISIYSLRSAFAHSRGLFFECPAEEETEIKMQNFLMRIARTEKEGVELYTGLYNDFSAILLCL